MAIAVTFVPSTDTGMKVPGSRRDAILNIAFDNSYPTGGYTLTAAQCGLTALHSVNISGASSAGRAVFWTGSKIKVFSAVSTEIANAVDLSADSVVLLARGT